MILWPTKLKRDQMPKHFCYIRLTQSLVFLVGLAAFVFPAYAGSLVPLILAPGGSVNPLPDFVDLSLQTDFPTKENFFGSGFSPTGAFAAFVNTSSLNPFGGQGLVFSYEVSIETGDVVQISVAGFSGFETAVQQTTAGVVGRVPAIAATRSSDGDTLIFDFAGIPGGFTDSSIFNIYTNALGYVDPLATITDASRLTAQFSTIGPSMPAPTTIPEPSSLSTVSVALAVVLFLFKPNVKRLFKF